MDLVVLYTSSPDWIKAMMVILPHVTLLGVAWLVLRRPPRLTVAAGTILPTPMVEVFPPAPARLDRALPDRELMELAGAGDITPDKRRSAALLTEDGASRCD